MPAPNCCGTQELTGSADRMPKRARISAGAWPDVKIARVLLQELLARRELQLFLTHLDAREFPSRSAPVSKAIRAAFSARLYLAVQNNYIGGTGTAGARDKSEFGWRINAPSLRVPVRIACRSMYRHRAAGAAA